MTGGDLARFLIRQRARIEGLMQAELGAAAPGAASAEAELLRRFRSWAAASLGRAEAVPARENGSPAGEDAPAPALEGVRVNDRRAAALLEAWVRAAAAAAAPHGEPVDAALRPRARAFVARLRQTASPRRTSGAPRAKRRAVSAAIDRVSDGFLALDADSARIVDANPAAGALLGVGRDALLGLDAMSFVPRELHGAWWTELDAMTEGCEPRRFDASLCDAHGQEIAVECSVTRFATRDRTLALVLARPRA